MKNYPISYTSCIGYVVAGLVFASGLGIEFDAKKTELRELDQFLRFVGGTSLVILSGIAQNSKREKYKVIRPDSGNQQS